LFVFGQHVFDLPGRAFGQMDDFVGLRAGTH
jgi:hypothetical protein